MRLYPGAPCHKIATKIAQRNPTRTMECRDLRRDMEATLPDGIRGSLQISDTARALRRSSRDHAEGHEVALQTVLVWSEAIVAGSNTGAEESDRPLRLVHGES